ncbi:amidohydrolase [Seminavis robusta]|uniref:Amidohydrolase n=1 Tax=Seminavis robusta TaxID=568900 RepID=A0A9N8EW58_9STRA|nr:amidohydrolase [Seminavis robusta]|eukprot:Sro1872_g302810.1 amidohydrolase (643) ;mRNA; f:12478-15099
MVPIQRIQADVAQPSLRGQLAASLLLLAVALVLPTACHAQTILRNGKIYTLDKTNLIVEAVAFNAAGVIETVGTVAEVTAAHPGYMQKDLQGQLLIPGFIDSHLHAVEAGINNNICAVPASARVEQIPVAFQNQNTCFNNGLFGGSGWAMGAGIDISNLIREIDGGSRTPLQVLDEYFQATPVVILDSFGHGALFNTAAAQRVGYTATSNPQGGQILVRNGVMIGIATENAQQALRSAAFPPSSTENQEIAYQSLLSALQELNRNGITTVSDAGGFWRQAQTEAWARAQTANRLTVRASNALYIYPDIPIDRQLSDLRMRFSNGGDTARLRFNAAKIYVDGILSLATGLLSVPYSNDPFSRYRGTSSGTWQGMEYFGNATYLNTVCSTLVSNGFQLHLHVTGDTGANRALNCIAAAPNNNGPHRLTHLFLVGSSDRSRFASLMANPDFQLTASSLNAGNIDLMRFTIGSTLTNEFLPANEVFQAGAGLMTLSSDWDADTLSPLLKLQQVLNRADGRSLPSLEVALQMYTINAANVLQMGNRVGTIATGKYADFALIDTDIFSVPTNQIGNAAVVATYLEGGLVFGSVPDYSEGGNNNPGCMERFYNVARNSVLASVSYVQSWFGSTEGGPPEDFKVKHLPSN